MSMITLISASLRTFSIPRFSGRWTCSRRRTCCWREPSSVSALSPLSAKKCNLHLRTEHSSQLAPSQDTSQPPSAASSSTPRTTRIARTSMPSPSRNSKNSKTRGASPHVWASALSSLHSTCGMARMKIMGSPKTPSAASSKTWNTSSPSPKKRLFKKATFESIHR